MIKVALLFMTVSFVSGSFVGLHLPHLWKVQAIREADRQGYVLSCCVITAGYGGYDFPALCEWLYSTVSRRIDEPVDAGLQHYLRDVEMPAAYRAELFKSKMPLHGFTNPSSK